MSFLINESCISCGACELECPNRAISPGDSIFVIDPAKCTECVGSYQSSRCASVCPVDACHPDPQNVEDHTQLLEKWRRLHPQEEPVVGTF